MIYDVKVNGILIQHLSRYTNGNLTQAGLALATVGARKYVKSLFCGHNRWCFPIDQEINWAAAQGDDVSLNTLIKCHHNDVPAQARINAARGGHLFTIDLLFTQGISVSGENVDKDSPLIMASRNGHAQVVKKLLEKGVNPCYISREWTHSTALFVAAEWGHLDCVNLLLATNARTQIDFQDRHNRTALMLASQRGYVQIVKVLLAAGAQVNLQDNVLSNALLHAVSTDCSSADYITILQDLLAAGSEVNFADVQGHAALFRARHHQEYSPHKKVIEKILLDHGAIES